MGFPVREAARGAGPLALTRFGFVRAGKALFDGLGMSSFSLSEAIWISSLETRFAPREAEAGGRTGLEGLLEVV